MKSYGPDSVLRDVLRNDQAAAVVHKYLPGIEEDWSRVQFLRGTLRQVTGFALPTRIDPAVCEALFAELASVPVAPAVEPVPEEQVPTPSSGYEATNVAAGSARTVFAESVPKWRIFELELHGPSHGNPFTDVDLSVEFRCGERTVTAHGFYDGDGVYRVRLMPDEEGIWSFRTGSNARSLSGISGTFHCAPAAPGDHGPVRVRDRFHFRYADGTRYLPLGTTSYAWTHQSEALEKQTLQSLADGPFNKIRMCVFPKSYIHNTEEPERYPYAGSPEEGWDFSRFDPGFFRHLEDRIERLGQLGIEADLILFHPYDRWGFSDMGPAADERYLRYVVARLAAHRNVWWSLANEYDLVWSKDADHWHRAAAVIRETDPHAHLIGNHNCVDLYDNSAEWVTHSSIQRPPERTAQWRAEWAKPVTLDEMGYEGDVEWGWGNLTPQEMVRRCWEGVVRGGYVTHGECFLDGENDVLWWSKGGLLKGESSARLAFLRTVMEQIPDDASGIDPLPSDFDFPTGGVAGRCLLTYFGLGQPGVRTFFLPAGQRWSVEVIDTWNMTITEVPGSHEGTVTVTLPGRPYLAVRLRVLEEDTA
ncbi:DUF5605 domain-containing protein [Streptomyces sp. NPDC051016]|uniref:DUF5605 domain-containing protein n=1 Tax=Streptomyces sp. NPDC051016 TaxID=3365638 RepID=UPI0037A890F1